MSELVDINVECEGVVLIFGGMFACVKILKKSLDSVGVLIGEVNVCFVLFLLWC